MSRTARALAALLIAAAGYRQENSTLESAVSCAEKLVTLAPDNPEFRQLLVQLRVSSR